MTGYKEALSRGLPGATPDLIPAHPDAPFNSDPYAHIQTLDPAPDFDPPTIDGGYVRELDTKAAAEAVRRFKEGPVPAEEGEF